MIHLGLVVCFPSAETFCIMETILVSLSDKRGQSPTVHIAWDAVMGFKRKHGILKTCIQQQVLYFTIMAERHKWSVETHRKDMRMESGTQHHVCTREQGIRRNHEIHFTEERHRVDHVIITITKLDKMVMQDTVVFTEFGGIGTERDKENDKIFTQIT